MMPKYIDAALAAETISAKAGIPFSRLVDVFGDVPPAADVVPTSIFTHAFVRLGLNRAYPIEHLDFTCNQVTVLESTNVHNTVSLNDVVLMTGDPVVHAQWVPISEIVGLYVATCSACGRTRVVSPVHPDCYCHACGAKMDEEANPC